MNYFKQQIAESILQDKDKELGISENESFVRKLVIFSALRNFITSTTQKIVILVGSVSEKSV